MFDQVVTDFLNVTAARREVGLNFSEWSHLYDSRIEPHAQAGRMAYMPITFGRRQHKPSRLLLDGNRKKAELR